MRCTRSAMESCFIFISCWLRFTFLRWALDWQPTREIHRLLHPEFSTRVGWSYAVLAISAFFDLYSWRISYREILARKDPNETTWDEIVGSKDPAVFTVFLEDSAGLIGVLIAFLGIFLGHTFHNPYLDPVASLLIALLLTAVALFLGRETGALLAGERTNRSRLRKTKEILAADPDVERRKVALHATGSRIGAADGRRKIPSRHGCAGD